MPKGCERDTDGDGNCHLHPQGCPKFKMNSLQAHTLTHLDELDIENLGVGRVTNRALAEAYRRHDDPRHAQINWSLVAEELNEMLQAAQQVLKENNQ